VLGSDGKQPCRSLGVDLLRAVELCREMVFVSCDQVAGEGSGNLSEGRSMTSRTVIAYGITWMNMILDHRTGEQRLLRLAPTAFDQWRTAVQPGAVPVLFDHQVEVGRFTSFTVDDTGLLTTAEYDRTGLADDLLRDMRVGRLTAYSCDLRFLRPTWGGETTRAGVRVYDLPEVALREAGPCYRPNDPYARVVSLAGVTLPDRGLSWPDAEHVLDTLSPILGMTRAQAREQAHMEALRARWRAEDAVDRAFELAREIGKERQRAEIALWSWRRSNDREEQEREFTDYLEATRLVPVYEEELRELLVNDEALISQVLRRSGIQPAGL
jgi:HK97 family phage prohead protease